MNSYNENLQNTVSATLQSQNLDLKGLKSQYKSAMYTLYYAEGATITAEEKLETATSDMNTKKKVKQQAVKNSSISANQLNSATQTSQYTGQSVSNVATCASNVQIAATAITRLAGDIGNIYNIVNAANSEPDIYSLTQNVNNLINITAYNAELTSDTAMEASAAISEVSASTVLNDSKATNALMTNILQIAAADLNTASQTVVADNTTLATVNTNEKLTEGAFESADIDYLTGLSAYQSVNSGLNLGLTAIPLSSDSFFVFFDLIKGPFSQPQSITPVITVPDEQWYPVKDYYIFVVKESKKLTFSISEAENLKINGAGQYVKLSPQTSDPASEITLPLGAIGEVISVAAGDTDSLQDSDGHQVVAGNNYVVFVMAVYTEPYKRLINNFNDFLSAPSLPFCMTTLLSAADNTAIIPVSEIDTEAKTHPLLTKMIEKAFNLSKYISDLEASKYLMLFEADSPANADVTMACECMFLPVKVSVPESLITRSSFDAFIDDQLKTDKIQLQSVLLIIDETIKILDARLKQKPAKENQPDEAKSDVKSEKTGIQQSITLLKAKKDELTGIKKHKTAFFFNRALAEIVPAGSYTTATQLIFEEEPTNYWFAFIGPATTDNFGNLLTGTVKYAPAILSLISSDDEKIVSQYTSNISDYENATPFSY